MKIACANCRCPLPEKTELQKWAWCAVCNAFCRWPSPWEYLLWTMKVCASEIHGVRVQIHVLMNDIKGNAVIAEAYRD